MLEDEKDNMILAIVEDNSIQYIGRDNVHAKVEIYTRLAPIIPELYPSLADYWKIRLGS